MNWEIGNNKANGVVEAIGEAANWRLAGLLLQRPHSRWWQEIELVSAELDHSQLKTTAEASRTATEGAYLNLFGPGGFVSPREVTYRSKEDPGRILADVAGIYRAFAFRPKDEDPIDHISVEANFAGFLCFKEAYALAEGDPGAVQTVLSGLRSFLIDHLDPFARALNERLDNTEPLYLAEAIHCLLDLAKKRICRKPANCV